MMKLTSQDVFYVHIYKFYFKLTKLIERDSEYWVCLARARSHAQVHITVVHNLPWIRPDMAGPHAYPANNIIHQ